MNLRVGRVLNVRYLNNGMVNNGLVNIGGSFADAIKKELLYDIVQCLNPDQLASHHSWINKLAAWRLWDLQRNFWGHCKVVDCYQFVSQQLQLMTYFVTVKMYSQESNAKWKVRCNNNLSWCWNFPAPVCPVWRPLCCKVTFDEPLLNADVSASGDGNVNVSIPFFLLFSVMEDCLETISSICQLAYPPNSEWFIVCVLFWFSLGFFYILLMWISWMQFFVCPFQIAMVLMGKERVTKSSKPCLHYICWP